MEKKDRLLILGDFNHGKINWEELDPREREFSWRSKFLECTQENLLHQHITEPTRARGLDQPSILDLVFSLSELDIENLNYAPPLGKSDHAVIHCDYRLKEDIRSEKAKRKSMRLNFAKANIK